MSPSERRQPARTARSIKTQLLARGRWGPGQDTGRIFYLSAQFIKFLAVLRPYQRPAPAATPAWPNCQQKLQLTRRQKSAKWKAFDKNTKKAREKTKTNKTKNKLWPESFVKTEQQQKARERERGSESERDRMRK